MLRAPFRRGLGAFLTLSFTLLGSCATPSRPATSSIGASDSTTSFTAPTSVADTTTTTPTTVRPSTSASPQSVRPTPPTTTRPTPTTRLAAAPPSCPQTLAGELASTGGAGQLVTVDAPSNASTTASVALWQRSGACWIPAGGPWSAHIGEHGLSSHHVEGDGTTPTGSYPIGSTTYGLAPDPGVHGTYHQLVCGDWWDEDPSSAQYNTFQHVPCGITPSFGGGSEQLWTQVVAYQHLAIIDFNTNPAVAGLGSAMFIHDDHGDPTLGCVSLPPADLDIILRWLQPAQAPRIVIGSETTIRQY